jgi:DUF438 domain-containing protein
MRKVDQLTRLLKHLNAGEDSDQVKQDTRKFLASLTPADLVHAEQKLIDAGMAPEDLRHLCSLHMEILKDQVEHTREKLPAGHVIDTLIREHDMILGFLEELEDTNRAIQKMDNYNTSAPEFDKLKHLADHLLGAEKHHQREEEVLFPEVEKRGLTGPPHIMKLEHEQLRDYKRELKELAELAKRVNFRDFKEGLDRISKVIVMTLRDHIFKENNILYPAALEMISEQQLWRQMRDLCDKIGYCCFTPMIPNQ